jgi:hypothetical protein
MQDLGSLLHTPRYIYIVKLMWSLVHIFIYITVYAYLKSVGYT